MKPLSLFCAAFFLSALVGCGTSVQESLKVNPDLKTNIGQGRKAVILPFADYTEANDLESAYRRNLFVTENLTDRFAQNGFSMPVQEDIFRYLVNRNIISSAAYSQAGGTSIVNELHNSDWSPAMKNTLKGYMQEAKFNAAKNPGTDSPGTLGLDQEEVAQIGQFFSADYVVRGSIIQYKTRQDPSWAPWKRGIITFVTGATNKLAFGQASADKYDEMGTVLSGATYGALYGDASNNWPYSKSNKSILGISGGKMGNTIFWGAVGSQFGELAYNAGDIPQAVVQLRMWVQSAHGGEVIWTNRVDVKVSPQSVLADYQYDTLFEGATEKAISTLMDDFMYAMNPSAQRAARLRAKRLMMQK